MGEKANNNEILEAVKQSPHKKVRVAITDIDGILRGKYMHRDKFISSVEKGFGFCDVVFGWDCADDCYDNVEYTGWHTGYPDANAVIDVGTFRSIPWNDDIPFFLADFQDADGQPLSVCPRQTLKRVIADANAMGYDPIFGLEFEWFNFSETPETLADKGHRNPEPLTPGMFGYSILRSSYSQDFFMALMDQLEAFGVPLEGLHTETGPGVYEGAIQCTGALEAADRGILFKTGTKEIANRMGVIPTFMAKFNEKLPGSSGHLHQSLVENGESVFYDAQAPDKMSANFKHYIAGQMLCLPEILPMYAPTVNSYKRLVEGMWAPTRVTWGIDNRTVALRAIPGSPNSTRLETRVPGADTNSYLAVAAALASGLYGIKNKLELGPQTTGNGYEAEGAVRLPDSLITAADKMGDSKIARELFGDAFVDHFVNSRRWEWRRFQQVVTNWEMERYFEII